MSETATGDVSTESATVAAETTDTTGYRDVRQTASGDVLTQPIASDVLAFTSSGDGTPRTLATQAPDETASGDVSSTTWASDETEKAISGDTSPSTTASRDLQEPTSGESVAITLTTEKADATASGDISQTTSADIVTQPSSSGDLDLISSSDFTPRTTPESRIYDFSSYTAVSDSGMTEQTSDGDEGKSLGSYDHVTSDTLSTRTSEPPVANISDVARVLDVCEPNPCLNGGICVPDGSEARCICFGDYSGPFCNHVDSADISGSGSGDFATDPPFADWKDSHSFSGDLFSHPSYTTQMADASGALWSSEPTGEMSKAISTTASVPGLAYTDSFSSGDLSDRTVATGVPITSYFDESTGSGDLSDFSKVVTVKTLSSETFGPSGSGDEVTKSTGSSEIMTGGPPLSLGTAEVVSPLTGPHQTGTTLAATDVTVLSSEVSERETVPLATVSGDRITTSGEYELVMATVSSDGDTTLEAYESSSVTVSGEDELVTPGETDSFVSSSVSGESAVPTNEQSSSGDFSPQTRRTEVLTNFTSVTPAVGEISLTPDDGVTGESVTTALRDKTAVITSSSPPPSVSRTENVTLTSGGRNVTSPDLTVMSDPFTTEIMTSTSDEFDGGSGDATFASSFPTSRSVPLTSVSGVPTAGTDVSALTSGAPIAATDSSVLASDSVTSGDSQLSTSGPTVGETSETVGFTTPFFTDIPFAYSSSRPSSDESIVSASGEDSSGDVPKVPPTVRTTDGYELDLGDASQFTTSSGDEDEITSSSGLVPGTRTHSPGAATSRETVRVSRTSSTTTSTVRDGERLGVTTAAESASPTLPPWTSGRQDSSGDWTEVDKAGAERTSATTLVMARTPASPSQVTKSDTGEYGFVGLVENVYGVEAVGMLNECV